MDINIIAKVLGVYDIYTGKSRIPRQTFVKQGFCLSTHWDCLMPVWKKCSNKQSRILFGDCGSSNECRLEVVYLCSEPIYKIFQFCFMQSKLFITVSWSTKSSNFFICSQLRQPVKQEEIHTTRRLMEDVTTSWEDVNMF